MIDPFIPHPVTLHDVDPFGSGGFQLQECGFLRDCVKWRFIGLRNPFWRLYYNGGKGSSVVIGGRTIPLLPSELLIIPENTTFDALGAPRVSHLWVHFSPPVSLSLAPGIRHVALTPALEANLAELRQRLSNLADESPQDKLPLYHLCLGLLHDWLAEIPPGEFSALHPALVQLLERIDRSLRKDLSNAVLASHVGMSVEGFIRWFKEWTGTPPARYVAARRIREASRLLLLSEASIEEIAEATGFANRHHFSRVFLRHAHYTPAQFRREQRRW